MNKNITESILISGATGLIGRSILKHIDSLNAHSHGVIYHIIVSTRNIEKSKQIIEKLALTSSIEYIYHDNNSPLILDKNVEYMICAGAVTDKKTILEKPYESYMTNFYGIHGFLSYALKRNIKSLVFLSSAVVYGRNNCSSYAEDYIGNSDRVRNSYTASKESGEFLCNAFFQEYGLPVKIARIFQVYGDECGFGRGTFLSDCIKSYNTGESLYVKNNGNSIRNLIHADDAASAVICILLKGLNGETYNVGSRINNLSFKEIAKTISECFENKSENLIAFENIENTDNDVQIPSIEKLLKLGWVEKKDRFEIEIKKIL